jgi:pantoate--beta-alanine ligase
MKLFKDIHEWVSFRKDFKDSSNIGFVPTMGSLHKGHISLIKRSINENKATVVSIFLNPTQFDNKDDLKRYPIKINNDLEILKKIGVKYVLIPTEKEIYKNGYNYRISEHSFSFKMEGISRDGHFDGVLTIVMKLLNIVEPHNSYFGEKDFQQYKLIKNMCNSFFMNTNIIACKTIREDDGLAYSSRNLLMNKKERIIAPKFYKTLISKKNIDEMIKDLKKYGFIVEYIEKMDGRIFGAVKLGKIRLIDNEKL